jgi:hypothetical protein
MELNLFEPSLLLVSDFLYSKTLNKLKLFFLCIPLLEEIIQITRFCKINPALFVKMVKIRRGNNVKTGPVSSSMYNFTYIPGSVHVRE